MVRPNHLEISTSNMTKETKESYKMASDVFFIVSQYNILKVAQRMIGE